MDDEVDDGGQASWSLAVQRPPTYWCSAIWLKFVCMEVTDCHLANIQVGVRSRQLEKCSCSIKWQNASQKQNTLAGETFIHIRKLLVVSDCYAQLLNDTDYNGRRWRFQMLMEFEEKIPWMEVKGGFTLIDRVNGRRWTHKLLNPPTPISLSHCPCMRKNPNKKI